MQLCSALIGTAIVLLGAGARADTVTEVEQAVHTVQTAFDKGDVEVLRGLMASDHVTTLTYARFSNAADQLKVLSDFKFSKYDISDLEVKPLTDDVAVASYRAAITGTYKGKRVPSPVRVTEIWVRREGKWQQAYYLETPLATGKK
jgi:predicted lipid-binding transport protein (Tim44 family)